ncbi:MAG: leucine--tRNA ligase [Candidatus Yonathbacteria bacterium]|nr:leucine--tRNA ligase [Candidatus Yonathbacteria bacterium]
MKPYNHKSIESKWQKEWAKKKLYKTSTDVKRKKCYVLDMFPYPSGEGLHVGHPKGYIASDIYARFKRMNGFNVLHPMGWDAFGLPAEQYAIKTKTHPRASVLKNTKRYKEQLSIIGFSYDWEKEINTTDPEYYRWTQWAFIQMFKKGLAYESHEPINWCPSCMTGLANEDLEGDTCERCGTVVEKKPVRQWVLRITKYANRLLKDIDALNWPESIKESQRNWIGRSEGAEIDFKLIGIPGQDSGKHSVKVFTTRPDTLFGATFLAISAELAQKWIDVGWLKPSRGDGSPDRLGGLGQASGEVKKYIQETIIENSKRGFDEKEKTGVFSGIYAINLANQQKIPVWVVNYVLGDVGTGAIMAVPAHDERDFAFAKKYNLPILQVICQFYPEAKCPILDTAYTGGGSLVMSGTFNGVDNEEAKDVITKFVAGKKTVTYKLRDWVFSRQRYWGEPIPLIHCKTCGVVPVPEKDLPIKLPNVKSYEPTGTGESPLAGISKWVNVKCPQCKGPAKRETNTMPQWAGSSWYYLRYIDPKNKTALVDKKKEKYWSPVDMYVGGAEHATRHLIYARFWHKFLYDIGAVSYQEPFSRLQNVGIIHAEDGRKMSKRYGNVVNPDDIVATYGADTLRLYEMFIGPFNQSVAWSTESIIGPRRFLEKVWRLAEKLAPDDDVTFESLTHRTIKKITEDIESFSLNTAVSALMIFVNAMEKAQPSKKQFKTLLLLLAPFVPHMSDELWQILGHKTSIHLESWPKWDEGKIKEESVTIMVQVNGKIRGSFVVTTELSEEEAKDRALGLSNVQKWIEGKEIKKVIYVKGKLVSIVI